MVEFESNNPVTWIPIVVAFAGTIIVGGNIVAGYKNSSQSHKGFKLVEGFSMLIRDLRVLVMFAFCGLGVWLLRTSSASSGLDMAKANTAAYWAVAALAALAGLQALMWCTNSILNSVENRKLKQFTNRADELERQGFKLNVTPVMSDKSRKQGHTRVPEPLGDRSHDSAIRSAQEAEFGGGN